MTDHLDASLAEAIREELAAVDATRGTQQVKETETCLSTELDKRKLFGLAFSGGGIRSATFNLGVLQALERIGLLQYVDYLSTVSGGGYIGSWYLSCLRAGILVNGAARPAEEQPLLQRRVDAALGHLRKFSRYLAPEAGLFSADTWTIAMVWLRNTILLQATLVSLFALLLLLPRYFAWGFLHYGGTRTFLVAGVLFAWAVIQIIFRLGRMTETNGEAPRAGASAKRTVDGQGKIQLAIVLPLMVAAACFGSVLWRAKQQTTISQTALLGWASAAVALATCGTSIFSLLRDVRSKLRWWVGVPAIGALCGGLFFGLASVLALLYDIWTEAGRSSAGPWLAGLVGAPLLLIALSLTVVLQIGLMGRAIDDARREWWSRLGAFLTIYSAGALVLDVAALYGPLWVAQLTKQIVAGASLGLGGVATTIGGLMAARSKDTSGTGKSSAKEILAVSAPYVFIAGLLLLVSTGVHYVLTRLQMGHYPKITDMPGIHWLMFDGSIGYRLDGSTSGIGTVLTALWNAISHGTVPVANVAEAVMLVQATLACVAVLLLLAWRVDINEASMNPFYCNRLVRCYLGAARQAKGLRHPNLFTGFDFADDFALADLKPEGLADAKSRRKSKVCYTGPVPIVNTALNLTGADNAALEERRAASFFFTPYKSGSAQNGFIETRKTGKVESGLQLGICVATSGAAASPNMGYHTSAPVAFLMTFFNVRLGLWIRNPKLPEAKQSPRWGIWYLLKELFATASADDDYIYLSDGGHFENLGVYELIRRRCRYIIACDAEQDENLVMEGLGGLVRKCRIDFNVTIDINTSQIRLKDEAGRSKAHCAVGRIEYPDSKEPGYLIYLKSSMTGDEDSDVLQYKAQHAAFPHESTGDQFYGESQFESYRCLGDHIAYRAFQGSSQRQAAGAAAGAGDPPAPYQGHPSPPMRAALVANREGIEELMKNMEAAWKPPSPYTERRFAHHTEELSRLWDEIRKGDAALNLDKELFPGWKLDPGVPGQPSIREGMYLCQKVLQLMENVYLDLHLETEWNHPDNEGWRALFLHWVESPTLREVYSSSSDTYGSRFRQFCQQRLKLQKAGAAGAGKG